MMLATSVSTNVATATTAPAAAPTALLATTAES